VPSSAAARPCADARRTEGYARRRPELGTLYQLVADNYRTLEAAAEAGFVGALPAFVKEEFERYLECGLLCRGFGLLSCQSPTCGEMLLVPFSCKGRAWCPSCCGRRMAQSAANLVDHVLPPRTPLRQYVLTLPFELRARLAYDGALFGEVTRLFVDSVLGFYRRTMRDRFDIGDGHSGAVTAVQRTSSDLRLNPHLHSAVLDGVFTEGETGELAFRPLPSLDNSDTADLLQTIRARVLAMLERRGVIESRLEPVLCDDGFAGHCAGSPPRFARHPARV
jgi:Transposase zinc-binding domain/Putative transposase